MIKRRGIAMIMAIAVIVILGTIMALTLALSSDTTKRTVDNYIHEQAILLTRSATELAILEISGTSLANFCNLTTLNAVYPSDDSNKIFDINTSIHYIGFNCSTNADYIASINTPESNGTILIDVIVTSSDDLGLTEPIRYHRRTLQKL